MYRVRLQDMDLEITAYAAGKMKKFNIKIIPGDIVTVQLNSYEPTKGRIVFRKINKDT
jgi:translation initiation factor IF-1